MREHVISPDKSTFRGSFLRKTKYGFLLWRASRIWQVGELLNRRTRFQTTGYLPSIATIKLFWRKSRCIFYEPNLTGLDCGYAFANQLVKNIDETITILLVPVAVGGSSSQQWLGDSLYRNVKLLSNFKNRVEAVKKYGTIKGVLWHQGESDTQSSLIAGYGERLKQLFSRFRKEVGNPAVPIFIGELGSYSENQTNWNLINEAIHKYAEVDKNAFVINTQDLKSKDDKIHFNSEGQRMMGERMAKKFLEISN